MRLQLSTVLQCLSLSLGPFSSNSPGKLNVLGHYSHPLGMDGTQVGVLKKTHKICFGGLLKSENSMALESQVSLQKNHTNQLNTWLTWPLRNPWNTKTCKANVWSQNNKKCSINHSSLIPWSPVQFHEPISGTATCGSATQCSSGTYGFHCTSKYQPISTMYKYISNWI